MTGVKGKILKKLKTIKTIGYLKPDRILHVNASDGYVFTSPEKPVVKSQTLIVTNGGQEPKGVILGSYENAREPEVIDVSELMKDLEDEDMDSDDFLDDKENVRPLNQASSEENRGVPKLSEPRRRDSPASGLPERRVGDGGKTPLSEIKVSSFRRPDLGSGTLFDPDLLSAFEQAVMEVKRQEEQRTAKIFEGRDKSSESEPQEEEEGRPLKTRKIEEEEEEVKANYLEEFEERCPPGGTGSVILYTTGLRGVRKTFEDCSSIRFLLGSFRVSYFERDVSMHMEFRDELWKVLGDKVLPPRLFVKGRYIGGAEKVLGLHEQGKLRPLFAGIPVDRSGGGCDGCGGFRFLVCFNCNGSQRVVVEGEEPLRCPSCNENGLIICPFCC